MKKLCAVLSIAAGVTIAVLLGRAEAQAGSYNPQVPHYRPKAGYVPDAKTATRIAEAVLDPIYGHDRIKAELPLSATLHGDIWIVTGKDLPDNWDGGVAEVRLSKTTGEIQNVIHGK